MAKFVSFKTTSGSINTINIDHVIKIDGVHVPGSNVTFTLIDSSTYTVSRDMYSFIRNAQVQNGMSIGRYSDDFFSKWLTAKAYTSTY